LCETVRYLEKKLGRSLPGRYAGIEDHRFCSR